MSQNCVAIFIHQELRLLFLNFRDDVSIITSSKEKAEPFAKDILSNLNRPASLELPTVLEEMPIFKLIYYPILQHKQNLWYR